jgi:hypothetical protein
LDFEHSVLFLSFSFCAAGRYENGSKNGPIDENPEYDTDFFGETARADAANHFVRRRSNHNGQRN